MYVIQRCFICRPSYSTVSEDAVIEPRAVATLALTARRSNQYITRLDLIHTRLDLIHTRLDLIHTRLDLIHTRLDLIHTRLVIIHTRLDIIHTRLDLIHTRLDLIQTRLDLIHYKYTYDWFEGCSDGGVVCSLLHGHPLHHLIHPPPPSNWFQNRFKGTIA
jgi:hypothetical protein